MNKIFLTLVFTFLLVVSANIAKASSTYPLESLSLGEKEVSITPEVLNSFSGSSTISNKPSFMLKEGRSETVNVDAEKIYEWLEQLKKETDIEAVSPRLVISGNLAKDFTPPQTGIRLDSYQTTLQILLAIKDKKQTASAAIQLTPPEEKLSQTNNLGINELIGQGKSNFKGSPNNRRHNINTGVEKLKGLVLKPGEEFSFNENICPVDKSTGYLPELVIKADGTIPEYGGGLCQVSSTIFRAAMDAGLKIVQRKNHSYAVQYYAPQGTDATTYCGGVDFKFQNDTANAILIWPYLVGKDDLVFDIYGTKDSRIVVIEDPVQFDRKSNGAMKATWVRHVTKNGVVTTDTLNSNYLPPALFHKEEEERPPAEQVAPDGLNTLDTLPNSEITSPDTQPNTQEQPAQTNTNTESTSNNLP